MVTCLFPSARRYIDLRPFKPGTRLPIEQNMVDPKACVALERPAPIFPERIDGLIGVQFAQSVAPSLLQHMAVSFPHLRREERIVPPPLGRIDIQIGWHHVEITGDDHRRIYSDERGEMVVKSLEPAQFEVELGSRAWIAIG